MPIINMARSKEDAEAHVGATNVRDASYTQDGALIPMWLYDTYTGLCIMDWEKNGYHDSDFFMMVWNPITKSTETICFASTRGWCYPCMASSPDATPDVMAEYEIYKSAIVEKNRIREEKRLAAVPAIGKDITVIKGRKYKNMEGRIFWMGTNKFKPCYDSRKADHAEYQCYGIEKVNGEKIFVTGDMVKVSGQDITAEEALYTIIYC